MSPTQRRVLVALDELTDPGEWWAHIGIIAEHAGLDYRRTRVAVRALARQGLASYERLFDDDGRTAGSGYGVTHAGRRVARLGEP